MSMIRKYHNHKLQTTPWHCEEEPLNHHETPGRQIKQSNFKVSVLYLVCVTLCPYLFCNHLDGEERAGCFALFVFLVSHEWCVALPHDAAGLSAVCDCGIS